MVGTASGVDSVKADIEQGASTAAHSSAVTEGASGVAAAAVGAAVASGSAAAESIGAMLPSVSPPTVTMPSAQSPTSPMLPILIIPGFMSSGLEVHRSSIEESWTGKRIWINLTSLGIQKVGMSRKNSSGDVRPTHVTQPSEHDGEEVNDEDDEEQQQRRLHAVYKNMWIQHMTLSLDDMSSEHPAVEVRPMKGLAAVDYLTPGALTDHVSYVFGPVIKALQKVGYQEGVNLDAAPYDWRLAPSVLEDRHQYFSDAMKKVEKLYEDNNNMPVVLLCHSLGCKVGHYFLNFAESHSKGWTDKYVHTYMPVGAPHLGAPKAMRASITGDKMGLDVFLNTDEATALGRSFGSGPWLIPELLPSFAPPNVHLRREGAFEITVRSTISDVGSMLESREVKYWPKKLQLVFKLGTETIKSRFAPLEDDGSVSFEQKVVFSTGPDGPNAKRCCCCRCSCCRHDGPPRGDFLQVQLCEPGLRAAKKKKKKPGCFTDFVNCCLSSNEPPLSWMLPFWLIWLIVRSVVFLYLYLFYFVLYKVWVLLGDSINRASDGSSILARAEPINMHELVDAEDGRKVEVDLIQTRCCLCGHVRGSVALEMSIRWISPDPEVKESERCHIAESKNKQFRHIGKVVCPKRADLSIVPTSGCDVLRKEGNDPTIRVVETIYDADPLDPRGSLGSHAPPPAKNVKAIYGINLPTEVGAVYRRRKAVLEKETFNITHMYKLDCKAELERKDMDGYVLEEGILKETQSTPQMLASSNRFQSSAVAKDFKRCSGDGTVPYWSLQHCRTWEKACNVSITELEGAEHREILADGRFHRELIDYVTTKNSGDVEDKV